MKFPLLFYCTVMDLNRFKHALDVYSNLNMLSNPICIYSHIMHRLYASTPYKTSFCCHYSVNILF